ncbi:MAG TPA: DNA repair protein RecO [Candidatus Binatia bacterium]|nr:DNA repair protein RecO [Candidatus Binatia bacterium]
MRASHVTPAIVLRSRPFGESDKIVSFMTETHGKLTGIAKGAMRSRKRFVNSLEPFALINLHFLDRPHNSLAFISAADLQRPFVQITTSLNRISYASYLVEITDGLSGEREESPAVFRHLKDGLAHVEENGTSLRFLTYFELKLLQLAGYQPIFDNCKRCRKDRRAIVSHWCFSAEDGGILCETCARSRREVMPLSVAALEVLITLQGQNNSPTSCISLPSSAVREIRSVMLRFVQYHVDREIKSASFLYPFSSLESS